nr:hypothetical protein [Myxococcaceae bacterium]
AYARIVSLEHLVDVPRPPGLRAREQGAVGRTLTFEQVVVVDYRLYFDTIAALVRRFRITDLFVQNATLTANDPYHRGRLKLVLFTPVSFVDGKAVIGRPR